MSCIANLSPKFRPPTPSLDRGPVQRRARRAFVATGLIMMTTPQIAEWTHPRGGSSRRHAYRYLRDVLDRYCVCVGRSDRGSVARSCGVCAIAGKT
jgi:hypothetical protein